MSIIPPFAIGQEVEAIETHHQEAFQRGQRFFVTGVFKGCCSWNITIGITNNKFTYTTCNECDNPLRNPNNQWLFKSTRFRAIVPEFETISYTKILEEIPMGVN